MNLGKMKAFAMSHNMQFPFLKANTCAAVESRIVFVIYTLEAQVHAHFAIIVT
jgi:hypothetical protein